MKVWNGTAWVDASYSVAADEVFVGPDAPPTTYEVWVDTDDNPTPAPVGWSSGTYVPTLTGMAVGTGGSAANNAAWVFIGGSNVGDVGVLIVDGKFVFGTAGASGPGASAEYGVSLPPGFVTAPQTGGAGFQRPIGRVHMNNGSIAYIGSIVIGGTTSRVHFFAEKVDATYNAWTNLAATIPFSWAAGHFMDWEFTVRAVRV